MLGRLPTVHPHACGENTDGRTAVTATTGTPPRVWGKLIQRVRNWSGVRYTPTRVGKTATPPTSPDRPPVHPHACGENDETDDSIRVRIGTPPRVWGKRKHAAPQDEISRYTPTRVGKTWQSHGIRVVVDGTPPRVWGKLPLLTGVLTRVRYTPTRVGKTPSAGPPRTRSSVHPHACGENVDDVDDASIHSGTPPRVWGKRNWGNRNEPLCRYTPTRVGKTTARSHSSSLMAVHPHACGENAPRLPNGVDDFGTPPRVWGKRL